jgi:hypothetical protein
MSYWGMQTLGTQKFVPSKSLTFDGTMHSYASAHQHNQEFRQEFCDKKADS